MPAVVPAIPPRVEQVEQAAVAPTIVPAVAPTAIVPASVTPASVAPTTVAPTAVSPPCQLGFRACRKILAAFGGLAHRFGHGKPDGLKSQSDQLRFVRGGTVTMGCCLRLYAGGCETDGQAKYPCRQQSSQGAQ